MFDLTADIVFSDGPSSNPNQPQKAIVRRYLRQFEDMISAGLSNGGLIYDTKASMDADLAHDANASAWVMTGADAGIYRKSGASGSGSWARIADLPYNFIPASNAGAGTANAIVATTSIPIPAADGGALIALPIVADNTATPVTVAFNGGSALTIKTNSGNDVAVGGLAAGMIVAGYVSGSTFRLLSDQVDAAIVAAAEAAQAAAEQAQAAAEAAAASTDYIKVSDYAALKLVDPLDHTGALVGSNQRTAIWNPADLSTEVAADTLELLYVAPDSDPTGASGAWALAADDGLYFRPRPATAPAIVRNVGDWMRTQKFLPDFAPGTTPTDWAETLQTAVDETLAAGGELTIPAGAYNCSAETTIDMQGITGAPDSNQRRIKIRGQGQGNTVLKSTADGMEILSLVGDNPLTSASHAYTEIADLAFAGNSPTSRTSYGLRIQDMAYLRLRNLSFHHFLTCMVTPGMLSSLLDNVIFNESGKGIVTDAGASGPHSNVYIACQWRQLTSLALDAFTSMSGATFINARVEGCGTHGNAATGGMIFRMSGSAGEAGPTFIGGYIEGNGGGFDFSIQESASQRVNANFFGTIFNRVSSSKFVTNNIVTSGDVDINLGACTFSSYNDYTPDAGRPYLNLSSTTRLRDFGCRWEDAVEAPTLGQSLPYAGFVDGSAGASVGANALLPRGWSVAHSATGIFVITHNLGHTNYAANATVMSSDARFVERIVRQTNSIQVVTKATSDNSAQNADFGFSLQVMKPGA